AAGRRRYVGRPDFRQGEHSVHVPICQAAVVSYDNVIAVSHCDIIIAVSAYDYVIAVSGTYRIIAALLCGCRNVQRIALHQRQLLRAGGDVVSDRPVIAQYDVIAAKYRDAVATRAAKYDVVSTAGYNRIIAAGRRRYVGRPDFRQGEHSVHVPICQAAVVSYDNVIAVSHSDIIIAVSAYDYVIAVSGTYRIIAALLCGCRNVQRIALHQRQLLRAGGDVVSDRPVIAQYDVIAAKYRDAVATRAAKYDVVSTAGYNRIIAAGRRRYVGRPDFRQGEHSVHVP